MNKQYYLDFSLYYSIKKTIIDMMNESNVDCKELNPVVTLSKNILGKTIRTTKNNQETWGPEEWIKYIISKGFWIDSHSRSQTNSRYDSTTIVITHYVKL